jgi:hypothetical protein
MRYAGFVALAVIILACGPDPNAKLPVIASSQHSGGAGGDGGQSGEGGTSTQPKGGGGSTTVGKGGSGGASSGNGGRTGSGGSGAIGGKTGMGTGGVTGPIGGRTMSRTGGGGGNTNIGNGGVTGTGGRVGGSGGIGGRTGAGGIGGLGGRTGAGGNAGIDGGGVSTAACANATPISQSVAFKTTQAFCFVTCDQTQYGWGCDSFTEKDRTVTVNGKSVTCGGALPPANTGGYWYFEIGAGGNEWDAIHFNGPLATACPKPAGGFAP